jgi:hypothetical protein
MVLDVDVRNAEAFCQEDKDMIFGWIQDGVGFVEMNQVIKNALRKWMVTAGQKQLKQLEGELADQQRRNGGDIGGRKKRELAKLRHSLANVMYNMEYYKSCEALFRKDYQTTAVAHGESYTGSTRTEPFINATAAMPLPMLHTSSSFSPPPPPLPPPSHFCPPPPFLHPPSPPLPFGNNFPPETVTAKSSWANTLNKMGKHKKALPLCRQVVAWRRENFGELHPRTLVAMATLAESLRLNRRLSEAEFIIMIVVNGQEALLDPKEGDADAMAILKTENPPEISYVLSAKTCLGKILRDQKRYSEALAFFQTLVKEMEAHRGKKHPHVQLVNSYSAEILEAQGYLEEAETMMQEVVENWWEQFGHRYDRSTEAVTILARIYKKQGTKRVSARRALLQGKQTWQAAQPRIESGASPGATTEIALGPQEIVVKH